MKLRSNTDRHTDTPQVRPNRGEFSLLDLNCSTHSETNGKTVTVNPDRFPSEYDRFYNLATAWATKKDTVQTQMVLGSVYDTVSSLMRYSRQDTMRLLYGDISDDSQPTPAQDESAVDLSVFMDAGVGVSRHMALACAATLERFKNEGLLDGQISVDRNTKWESSIDGTEGHTWVRFTSNEGQVTILDVARNYFGSLQNCDPHTMWIYLRPEDMITLRKKVLGNQALTSTTDQLAEAV